MKEYPIFSRLSSFTGRAVVFFTIASALFLFFFVVGNYQEFLDSTQGLLLAVLTGSLSLQVVCGIFLAVMLVRRSAVEGRPFLARWILLVTLCPRLPGAAPAAELASVVAAGLKS